uniref:Piwi-domain-containing protein n=1 Tax=Psoroptes ovis TaxID=83912 RepID=A0A3B0QN36_PSOOV|nr:Piwi-domain-containing protein [Psoroptes ovis]
MINSDVYDYRKPVLTLIRSIIAINKFSRVTNINKFNDNEISKLWYKHLYLNANDYLEFVMNCINNLKKLMPKNYGIKIKTEAMKTYGQQLIEPKILPNENEMNSQFYMITPKLLSWALFVFDENFDKIEMNKFRIKFENYADYYGLKLNECFVSKCIQIDNINDVDAIYHNLKLKNIDFVIFGISRGAKINNIMLYDLIKYYGNTIHGLINQVFCTKSISGSPIENNFNLDDHDSTNRIKNSYFDNFLLKLCLKIKGQPNIIHPDHWQMVLPYDVNMKTMLIGINDLIRNYREEKLIFNTIIGTCDKIFTRYISITKISQQYDEQLYESMFNELMEIYYKKNKYYPDIIIMFQKFPIFDCKKILESNTSLNKIKLTVINVDKNSSSYFFPLKNDINYDNRILVDNFLCYNSSLKEFFINIKMPCKSNDEQMSDNSEYFLKSCLYTVIYDDCNFNDENIQEFCYTMCNYYCKRFECNLIPVPLEFADHFNHDGESRFNAFKIINHSKIDKDDYLDTIDKIIEYFNENLKLHKNLEYSLF